MIAAGARSDRAAMTAIVVLSAVLVLFFVLPLAGLIDRAIEEDGTRDVVTSRTAREALTLSLWTSTLTLVIAVVAGTPVAYALARGSFRGKSVLDALVDLPIVLPPTVAGVALLTAFGRKGLVGEPLDEWTGVTFAFTRTAIIMAQLLVAAPFYIRAASSGFAAVDPQTEHVAYTLGESRVRTFFRITVPQAMPALLAGMVLCWARALGELGATLIFAGNLEGKTQTMPLAIIQALEGSSLGLTGAIALSLILLAVAAAVLVAFRLLTRRSVLDR